jgi:hypothetical protein
MNKRFLFAMAAAAAFTFGTCSDSVFYTISKEVTPVEALIKGGPANFAVYDNYMYAASGRKLFRYKDGNWSEALPRPGGRIRQLAAAGGYLYALCYADENLAGSTRLMRYDGSGWQETRGDTGGFNTFQSAYSANGTLFVGAERNDSFAILYVDGDAVKLLTMTGQKAMLCGAAFLETDYFLCTEGHTQNGVKTGGVYTANVNFSTGPTLIPNTSGIQFTGIITIKDSVAAMDRSGKLYAVTAAGLSVTNASLDRESTGALAIWRDGENAPRLLLAGRGSLVEGYTYGYMELNITDGVLSGNFSEPGENSPSTIIDNNKELYISTIGKESVTHLFQAPKEIDANMTLFASTQKNGVWSFKKRDGKWQWNAEK